MAPAGLALSACKQAEQGDNLVVRVYNTTNEELDGRLTFGVPVQSARFVNLNEEPTGDAAQVEGSQVLVPARPFRVLALEVRRSPVAPATR